MAQKSGEAAPSNTAVEGEDIGDDILDAAAGRFGVALPKAPNVEKEPAKGKADETTDDEDDGSAEGEDTETEVSEKATDDDAAADDEKADEATESEDDETDADDPAKKLASETKQFVNVKLKDLPEELRSRVSEVVNKRIGKISADAKAEQARLESRVEELTDELEEAKTKGGGAPVNIPGLHPLFLATSESEIEKRLAEIEQFEDFADKYRDGYEGDGTPQNPSWSAERIRSTLREVQRERDKIIPAARANLAARGVKDAELKKTFPVLFDRKSEEYRSAQALTKLMPELRRHADMNVLIARLILGEKALAQLGKPKAAPTKPATQTIKKAPRVPGSGGPAKGSAVDRSSDNRPAASDAVNKAYQQPGNKQAFNNAVAALIADI